MNKNIRLVVVVGAFLFLAATLQIQQASAFNEYSGFSDEINTETNQKMNNEVKQVNRNGDNYLVIKQNSVNEVREVRQEPKSMYMQAQLSGKDTFKVNVYWSGDGELCIYTKGKGQLLECQNHEGGTALFVLPKGIIPEGTKYVVCGNDNCETFRNLVPKGQEYVALD